MATRIPSQAGHWTITRDPAMGLYWIAEHSELERCTDAGGPVSVESTTLAGMLVDLIAVESEGDFGGFCSALEATVPEPTLLDEEQLAEVLLRQAVGRARIEAADVFRIALAFADAMVGHVEQMAAGE